MVSTTVPVATCAATAGAGAASCAGAAIGIPCGRSAVAGALACALVDTDWLEQAVAAASTTGASHDENETGLVKESPGMAKLRRRHWLGADGAIPYVRVFRARRQMGRAPGVRR